MEKHITQPQCEEFQIRFLENPDDPQVAAHLAGCSECAEFALFHDALVSTDDRILNTPPMPAGKLTRLQNRRVWSFSAAAAAAVCLGTAVFVALQTTQNNFDNNIIAYIPTGITQSSTSSYAMNSTDNNSSGDASTMYMSWDESDEAKTIEALQQEFDLLYNNNADWKIQEYTPYIAME